MGHPHSRVMTTVLNRKNRAMALRASGAEPGQSVLLLLNVGDDPVEFAVDAAGLAVAEVPDPDEVPADPLTVAPHSWTILA